MGSMFTDPIAGTVYLGAGLWLATFLVRSLIQTARSIKAESK